MADSDGTFSVPFWVKLVIAVPFIPEPWKTIIRISVAIFDQLPQPHQDAVRGAASQAIVRGDHTIFTGALDAAARRDATDRTR